MDKEQEKLYKEWRELENSLRRPVIQYSDIQKAKQIRQRAWDELRDHVTIAEKLELGSSLEKPLKEIFDKKYPPEDWPLSKQWATRAIHRASGGLNFLLECLEYIHRGGTDAAFSRSLYILLSFNFELILKSRLLLSRNQTKREDFIQKIKSHNLETLSKKLSENELGSIDVKGIQQKNDSGFTEYVIEMVGGSKIVVQDLVDVRYDFEKDIFRNLDHNEANRMRSEIEALLGVTKKIMKML